jgi:hypothetical protein
MIYGARDRKGSKELFRKLTSMRKRKKSMP